MAFEPGWLLRQLESASKSASRLDVVHNLEGNGMSKVDQLRKEIKERMDQIYEIQNECSHPKSCVEKKYGSDTGNWDSSNDCYWVDLHCTLCDKKWTAYDDNEDYRKY